jgi:hypothetical protein
MPPRSRKMTATRRRRRPASRCTCVFQWDMEISLCPDGTVDTWISHESQCPVALTLPGKGEVLKASPEGRQLMAEMARQSATADTKPTQKPTRKQAPPAQNAASGRKRTQDRARTRHLKVVSPPGFAAAEALLDDLELITGRAPRSTGKDRWMALCPAHDDRNPSLSIRALPDKVLIHCFAGCPTEAVLETLQRGWGDLFEEEER